MQKKLKSWIEATRLRTLPVSTAGVVVASGCAYNDGSCMMGWFDEKRLKRLLGVPRSRRVLLVVSLGYSTQPLRQKQRRALDAVMGDNKY